MIALIALAVPDEDGRSWMFGSRLRAALGTRLASGIAGLVPVDEMPGATGDRRLDQLLSEFLGDARGASRNSNPHFRRRPPCTPPYPTN